MKSRNIKTRLAALLGSHCSWVLVRFGNLADVHAAETKKSVRASDGERRNI